MSKNHWNERFSQEGYFYGKHPNEFIKEKSKILPNQARVGCFAEGEGRNAVYLATLGHDVTSFDQSDAGLEKTKELAKENGVTVHTIQMDLVKEKAPRETFDAAVLVFGHVPGPDQSNFINNIIDSVKPGGYVLFELYSKAQIDYKTGGPPNVDNLYDPSDILAWIKDYHCLHFYYGEAERIEGTGHTGMGHVIQVAIKK